MAMTCIVMGVLGQSHGAAVLFHFSMFFVPQRGDFPPCLSGVCQALPYYLNATEISTQLGWQTSPGSDARVHAHGVMDQVVAVSVPGISVAVWVG